MLNSECGQCKYHICEYCQQMFPPNEISKHLHDCEHAYITDRTTVHPKKKPSSSRDSNPRKRSKSMKKSSTHKAQGSTPLVDLVMNVQSFPEHSLLQDGLILHSEGVLPEIKNGKPSSEVKSKEAKRRSYPTTSASAPFIETDAMDIPTEEAVSVPLEDESKVDLSFASALPPIVCHARWVGGCGTSNPPTSLRCSGCSHRLWSGFSPSGSRMRLGQNCAFFRAKSGILEDGVVVRISDDGQRVGVKVSLTL